MDRDLQDIKEEVRTRSDIVEIVSQHTRLKKSGKNWTGLCPFHADKKPSFSVSPLLQNYKCWSCGEGGDVFTFVQKKENLDFVEALEWLARRAGIPFERKGVSPERASEREQMYELNRLAVQYYQDRLARSPEARDYLAGRAILKATQDQWDIGYAPPDWDGLTGFLTQKRVDLELAARIGLLKTRKETGGNYDTFRNRMMFPIHDVQGRVIAFGGRAMAAEDPNAEFKEAKYLNSEQSLLFDKSRTLYGLFFARKKLSGETPAVFVEGYMDVIATHQAGFTQCVATLGTSLTEDHARLLARYNPRVVICYDGDEAGIKATLRGAVTWESIGIEQAEVRVARLPKGDDPDSLLKRGETAEFQKALDNAIPRVDFQMELALRRHDLGTENGRDNALAELIPILATVPSLTQRDRFAQKIAYLHPSHNYDIGRAITQILADVETVARQIRERRSPRDDGYPLTENANRGTLGTQPPPNSYRPAEQRQWSNGQPTWPNTQGIVRRGDNGSGGNSPWKKEGYNGNGGGYSNGGGYGKGKQGRYRTGPVGDPTPPPLDAPLLTGVEKAERQLLRALLSPQWRVYILSRIQEASLVTDFGKRMYAWAARTPAQSDGSIDPLPLLRQVQEEEAKQQRLEDTLRDTKPSFRAEEGESSDENPFAADASGSTTRIPAKFSNFISDIVEDSLLLVSNELLNEAAITDCIRRLNKERDRRELFALQRHIATLPPDQQSTAIEQYHQKMRVLRGSPPATEE